MGVVIRVSPTRCVRRKPPRVWSPELLKHLHPTFDAEDPCPDQLSLLRAQREAGQKALAKLG